MAAGGGGGGGAGESGDPGGAGGTATINAGAGGNGGTNREEDGAGGGGGTQAAGGGGGARGHGSYACITGASGTAGSFLQGGYGGAGGDTSGETSHTCDGLNFANGSGGGGGGGYYGGGGGGGSDNARAAGGGGGAGSNFVEPTGTYLQGSIATTRAPFVSFVPADTPPAFLSGGGTYGTVGSPLHFQVRASGFPLPTFVVTGSWPSGVFIDTNRNGTMTFTGTPYTFSGGRYTATVTAENTEGGTEHKVTEKVTFVIGETPTVERITGTVAYATVGKAKTIAVNTQGGYPTPTVSESGTLPSGMAFTTLGNGDARISGTPATGSGGTYPVTVTATSTNEGHRHRASYSFKVEVFPLPVKIVVRSTANPSASGQSVTFSASTTPPVTNDYLVFTIDGSEYAYADPNTKGVATAPPISSLGTGHHTITAALTSTDTGEYQPAQGTLTQTVQVLTGAASGTSVIATPQPTANLYWTSGGALYKKPSGARRPSSPTPGAAWPPTRRATSTTAQAQRRHRWSSAPRRARRAGSR